jgi:hypothetical protein
LKPLLSAGELSNVYFTIGLASLVLVNFEPKRLSDLAEALAEFSSEYWPIKSGKLLATAIVTNAVPARSDAPYDIQVPPAIDAELKVYTEQIAASLRSLWVSYGLYFPDERETLRQISKQAQEFISLYSEVHRNIATGSGSLSDQKKSNAITSALVEISAALSYAVTQGTSGSLPVLSNRSPFPHHSLLGVGSAIRGITKYTRYLESAFLTRSAAKVISAKYASVDFKLPASVPAYSSGPQYEFAARSAAGVEHFDDGEDLVQEDQVPLIAHFSLRHGFMESKFSVTAASESLTSESLPPWTLMTLSHEIMHSRVRSIFQALFGKTWSGGQDDLLQKDQFEQFANWIQARHSPTAMNLKDGLRNLVLVFCYAVEQVQNPVNRADVREGGSLSMDKLSEYYSRHKYFAAEILVHFHDYYFIYACHPKMYLMSIWASWIKVAGPHARPMEYLIRSLATAACGTGLDPLAAFDFAKEHLLDSLDSLVAGGTKSPLFIELRRLLTHNVEEVRAYFDPCYYLIDNIQLFFSSRMIASKIDRIEDDPFAEGSNSAETYSSSIYVFGEGKPVSPIRYSIASLFRTLKRQQPIADSQWLTGWNYLVVSS